MRETQKIIITQGKVQREERIHRIVQSEQSLH